MTANSADTSHFLFLATLKIQHGESVDAFYTFFIRSNIIDSMFVVSVEKKLPIFSAIIWSQDLWEHNKSFKSNLKKGTEHYLFPSNPTSTGYVKYFGIQHTNAEKLK